MRRIGRDDANRIRRAVNLGDTTDKDEIQRRLTDEFPEWSKRQYRGFTSKIKDLNVKRRKARRKRGTKPRPGKKPTGRTVSKAERNKIKKTGRVKGALKSPIAMVRTSKGYFFGRPGNVKVWTDKHGNTMGHNSNTGKRAKIA